MINPQNEYSAFFPRICIGIFDIDICIPQNLCNLKKSSRMVFHLHSDHIGEGNVKTKR